MPVLPIPLSVLPASSDQARSWCAQLEAGGILYFPQTPVPIPAADLEFLLGSTQSGSRLHKNIAYKPNRDALSGTDNKSASPAEIARLHDVMRRYSASVASFLANFLAPYRQRWQLDYASFRPIEEQGRDLSLRQRNDLLHTDAFPTRPTRGARILRFFHNIHPTRTRDWVVGDSFPSVVGHFVEPSLPRSLAPLLPVRDSSAARATRAAARLTGLAAVFPHLKRTPYDEFMMRLHNTMKEDAEFQRTCHREAIQFPPGSSWMVYTETVPHAVLAGQYALEQTFLVDAAAMVTPESAPIAVLEKMAGTRAKRK
jgi:3-deoxy-D-manno-oct-2-ulosonic acid (Kdo) hydroxylase